jgi:FkbM family methyltransferase
MPSIQNERFAFENVVALDTSNSLSLCSVLGNNTISSFDPEVVSKQSGVDLNKLDENIVPVKSLTALIESHNLSRVDLSQIDTEGRELAVLRPLDFALLKPRIIHFEHGHLNHDKLMMVFQLLDGLGYKIHFGGKQYMDVLAYWSLNG